MRSMWYFSVPRGQSRDEKAGLKLSCERSEPERGRWDENRVHKKFCGLRVVMRSAYAKDNIDYET